MIYIPWTQFDSQSYLTTIVVLRNWKMVHTHPVMLCNSICTLYNWLSWQHFLLKITTTLPYLPYLHFSVEHEQPHAEIAQ